MTAVSLKRIYMLWGKNRGKCKFIRKHYCKTYYQLHILMIIMLVNEKAGSRRESNPRQRLVQPVLCEPLSYDNQTTTNSHNPLHVLQCLSRTPGSQFPLFIPTWGKSSKYESLVVHCEPLMQDCSTSRSALKPTCTEIECMFDSTRQSIGKWKSLQLSSPWLKLPVR